MSLRPHRSHALVAILATGLLLVAACSGPVETAVCGLTAYTAEIQEQLDTLTALDPELVAQAGTPENQAALAALDALDATVAEAVEVIHRLGRCRGVIDVHAGDSQPRIEFASIHDRCTRGCHRTNQVAR